MPTQPGTDVSRNIVLRALEKGPKEAKDLVDILLRKVPGLSEERAGDIIWQLIDAHAIRVTDEAELEETEAVSG
jgi:hypothetical protein